MAELAGRPLIAHPLAAVAAAGLQPLVVAKPDSELPSLPGCEVIREAQEPRHPLCGIVTALRHTGRPVVVVSCDMPFLEPAFLAWLGARPEPLVAPTVDRVPQPFPARYDPVLLPELERALAEERSLRATIESLGQRAVEIEELATFGDPERILFNVNTSDDMARARELFGPPTT